MDDQRYTVNLHPPFADVRLEVEISDCHILLLYVGTAERLIESGTVEPAMAEVAPAKSRPRVDSTGFYYHREVRWQRGTRLLRIARHITDVAFAAQLPGGPQDLKFPRLDWLDEHPGRVSVRFKDHEYDGQPYRKKVTAGTVGGLIKSGFPAHLFDLKWSAGRFSLHSWLHLKPLGGYVNINRLMRGYFEVEESWSQASSTAQRPTDAEPERGRSTANLQLVWVNPVTA